MSGKEKINSALSLGGTTQIGAVICYEGIFLRDHWSQVIPYPWWYHESPNLEHQMAWRRSAIQNIQQDWFYLPECESREDRSAKEIVQDGSEVFLIDNRDRSMTRLQEPVVGGWSRDKQVESIHPVNIPNTAMEIDRLIPDPITFDSEKFLSSGKGDLAQKLIQEFGDRFYTIRHVSGPLWACYSLWGFEDWMVKIAGDPELVTYAGQRQLAHSLYQIQLSAALGANGIWIEDCLVDMISRRAYKTINLPLIQTLTDEIRARGMKSIYYYCGDPTGKLDLLLNTGADAIALEESKKGFQIDLEEIVKVVNGQCCLLGNLDAIRLLTKGSDEQLKAEIIRQIAIGQRNHGRFIMSIGSPVTPETPLERVQLYTSLVHQYGNIGGG